MENNQIKPLQLLRQMAMERKRSKYPNVPLESLPNATYNAATANGLTKCVIDFLTFKGWQAERINSTGRHVDRRKQYTDVLGRNKTVGGFEWIKGNGTRGTADISATIGGKSVKIEVKIKADRQSEAQKKYQQDIQAAGGIYYIAKDFDSFYTWYHKTFTK